MTMSPTPPSTPHTEVVQEVTVTGGQVRTTQVCQTELQRVGAA